MSSGCRATSALAREYRAALATGPMKKRLSIMSPISIGESVATPPRSISRFSRATHEAGGGAAGRGGGAAGRGRAAAAGRGSVKLPPSFLSLVVCLLGAPRESPP